MLRTSRSRSARQTRTPCIGLGPVDAVVVEAGMSRTAPLRLGRRGRVGRGFLPRVPVFLGGALLAPVTSAAPGPALLPGSAGNPSGATSIGPRSASAPMLVTLVLAPRGGDAMDRLIDSLSDPNSANYHHWLAS